MHPRPSHSDGIAEVKSLSPLRRCWRRWRRHPVISIENALISPKCSITIDKLTLNAIINNRHSWHSLLGDVCVTNKSHSRWLTVKMVERASEQTTDSQCKLMRRQWLTDRLIRAASPSLRPLSPRQPRTTQELHGKAKQSKTERRKQKKIYYLLKCVIIWIIILCEWQNTR